MKYVVMFRGINVGGKNIVKMADLKKLFADLGFRSVRNYIQSGNIVFETDEESSVIASKVSAGFGAAFGFESKMILRTGDEMIAIINDLPFSADEISAAEAADPDVEHLYVFFLEETMDCGEIDRLTAKYEGPDKLLYIRREIYLLCHHSVRDSKLAIMLGRLGTPMTARNWKTINKLSEILSGL